MEENVDLVGLRTTETLDLDTVDADLLLGSATHEEEEDEEPHHHHHQQQQQQEQEEEEEEEQEQEEEEQEQVSRRRMDSLNTKSRVVRLFREGDNVFRGGAGVPLRLSAEDTVADLVRNASEALGGRVEHITIQGEGSLVSCSPAALRDGALLVCTVASPLVRRKSSSLDPLHSGSPLTMARFAELATQKSKRVHLYRNGDPVDGHGRVFVIKRQITSLPQLLEALTMEVEERGDDTLRIRRLFLPDGTPVASLDDISMDGDLVLSRGEPFRGLLARPRRSIEKRRSLEIATVQHRYEEIVHNKRVMVYKNGDPIDGHGKVMLLTQYNAKTMDDLLMTLTKGFYLDYKPVRLLFDGDGTPVTDLNELRNEMNIVISQGEPFRQPIGRSTSAGSRKSGSFSRQVSVPAGLGTPGTPGLGRQASIPVGLSASSGRKARSVSPGCSLDELTTNLAAKMVVDDDEDEPTDPANSVSSRRRARSCVEDAGRHSSVIVRLYRNGRPVDGRGKIFIVHRRIHTWNELLEEFAEALGFHRTATRVLTKTGVPLSSLDSLRGSEELVVLERGEVFKHPPPSTIQPRGGGGHH